MKKEHIKFLLGGTFLLSSTIIFSSFAHAQTSQDLLGGIGTLDKLITTFNTTVVKSLGTLFLSLGVVAFFFGVVQYIWGIREGNEKKATDGKQFMIWGLVGLFVMFSVYGIIKFSQSIIFGNKDVNTIVIPTMQIGGSGNNSGSPSTNPLVPSSNTGSPSTNPVVGGGAGRGSVNPPLVNPSSSGIPKDGGNCMSQFDGPGHWSGGACVPGGGGGAASSATIDCGTGWHPDSNNTGCVPDTATTNSTSNGTPCTDNGNAGHYENGWCVLDMTAKDGQVTPCRDMFGDCTSNGGASTGFVVGAKCSGFDEERQFYTGAFDTNGVCMP